jgi:hypothetical protein
LILALSRNNFKELNKNLNIRNLRSHIDELKKNKDYCEFFLDAETNAKNTRDLFVNKERIDSSIENENTKRGFYTALTNIRTNNVTVQDEELLYSAVLNTQFSLDHIEDINKITILTSLKHQRLLYNEMCLNKLNQESPIQEYVAIDSGNAKKSVQMK